ncbi:hypothetical protein [Natrinema sp. CBA1119]|uniref:hypothetical protein n=1 Tax=Natrinema sp. CBA1119 TaxID=1608465 RepID=UPI0011460EF4|nr:hypothetical protein [Natrinema sp. CBA1119]
MVNKKCHDSKRKEGIGRTIDCARTRRSLLRTGSIIGATSLVVPGIAAANPDSDEVDSIEEPSNEEEGFRPGIETNLTELVKESEGQAKVQGGQVGTQDHDVDPGVRTWGGTREVMGVEVTFELAVGESVGWFEVGALGQSMKEEFNRADGNYHCSSRKFDGLVAYVDFDYCYNFSDNSTTIELEGCRPSFSGWKCTHIKDSGHPV